MTNSYGASEVPEGAQYGVYDTENGEWTGHWFFNEADAQAAAENWDDETTGIVSTTDDGDWLT